MRWRYRVRPVRATAAIDGSNDFNQRIGGKPSSVFGLVFLQRHNESTGGDRQGKCHFSCPPACPPDRLSFSLALFRNTFFPKIKNRKTIRGRWAREKPENTEGKKTKFSNPVQGEGGDGSESSRFHFPAGGKFRQFPCQYFV